MARSLDDSRVWMQQGAVLLSGALAGLDDEAFTDSTALEGWTRGHIVAHLCANAEAVGRLVHWAATGDPTPMYSSMEQRNADIEAGSYLKGSELTEWFTRSAAALDDAMAALTDQQWAMDVVTAQGRTVPASETPWMRSREVMVHAIDLGTGIGFDDLPDGFLVALCDDIVGKRSTGGGPALVVVATDTRDRWVVDGEGDPVNVFGSLADVTSYLSGRGANGVTASDGRPTPTLPAWL